MKQSRSQQSLSKMRLVLGLTLVGLVILGVVIAIVLQVSKNNAVHDFASCKDIGGVVMESYPEQCAFGGKTYANDSQVGRNSGYVGLTEQAACAKAKNAGGSCRVVERDGEAYMVTMDYSRGRANLYVKDGVVYRVQVEGEE